MSTKEVYPYFREINSGGAANCYTGSLCEVMRLTGTEIKECFIYLFGNGFKFNAIIDEFGDPKLFTNLFKTVDVFCKKYGITLEFRDINHTNAKRQILKVLQNRPIIVWLNSKYLKYSEYYYSQEEGYLHAIAIEKVMNTNLVRVIDSLIVSAPIVNCKADFAIEYLEKALFADIEKPEALGVTEKIITLTGKNTISESFEKSILRNNMYKNCIEILEDYKVDKKSAIMIFYNFCQEAFKKGDDKRKIWLLQRINKIIKTIWVIPNRKLLYLIIPELKLAKKEEEVLINCLNCMIDEWLVLASCCLKCSVQTQKIYMLEEYFIAVDQSEKIFWNQVNVFLKNYKN